MVTQRQGDVVAYAQVRNQSPVLEHHAHLTLCHLERSQPFRRNIFAKIEDVATSRTNQPRDNSQEGTLALTGTAANADSFPALHTQIHIREKFLLRVGFYTLEKSKRPGLRKHRPCDIAVRKVNIFHS